MPADFGVNAADVGSVDKAALVIIARDADPLFISVKKALEVQLDLDEGDFEELLSREDNALEEESGARDGFYFRNLVAAAYAKGGRTGFGIVRDDSSQLIAKDPVEAIAWYNRIIALDIVPEDQKVVYQGKIVQLRLDNNLDDPDDNQRQGTPMVWL